MAYHYDFPMNDILEFDSVELSFDGRKILSGVYMKCQQGEVVGILGRNGSGKSSLMKVVFGVLEAEHKSVRINGISLQGDYLRKRQIAYLPQDPLIPSYVTLGTAFKLYGVETKDIIAAFPDVKKYLSFRPYELSGGWTRLIESMMVLQSSAPFCFLDEPFTGLMPIHIETLKNIIARIKSSKGVIISDHMHRHVTELSDRIYVITDGRTIEVKEREQLVELGYLHSI